MSDWQVGDLAVCVVEQDGWAPWKPQVGVVYTVAEVADGVDGPGFELEEDPDAFDGEWIWLACDFRKIDKHEACEEEFITLLKRRKSPAQHEHIMDGLGDD